MTASPRRNQFLASPAKPGDGDGQFRRPNCYNEPETDNQNRKGKEMTSEPATPSMDRIIIETAQDFIDALKRHPQFQEEVLRHLLTAEMLGLPEQVKQLQTDFLEHRNEFLEHRKEFIELRNEFIEHRKEFIELRNEFIEHRKEFIELRNEFIEHRKEFIELRNEFIEHRKEFIELRNEFIEHRKEFIELRNEFIEHRKEFIELRKEFIELRNEFREYARKTDQRLDSIGGTVSRLDGANYENQAADYAPRRMRTILKLSQPSAIATPTNRTALHAIVDQAAVNGLISDDEADDLLLADAVFAAAGPDGSRVQVVAEASITAKVHDCDRAVRRAEIMRRATDETPTIPVVISAEAPDELVQERKHEVTFFHIPNKD